MTIFNWVWGGGVLYWDIDIIQMHFHVYLHPNKMGLTKLKLASHKRCTYSKNRTLPGIQRTTPAKHIKSFHVFQDQNTALTTLINKKIIAQENNYLEVLLMIMWKCLSAQNLQEPWWFISKHRSRPDRHMSKLWRNPGIIGQQWAGRLLAETVPSISKCVTIGQCMSICMGHSGVDMYFICYGPQ